MSVRSDAASDPYFATELFSGFLQALDYCEPTPTFASYPALLDTIGEALRAMGHKLLIALEPLDERPERSAD